MTAPAPALALHGISLRLGDGDTAVTALDRARAREVVELLARETRAEGTATVMVTHDPAILDAADRVHEMSDGRLT